MKPKILIMTIWLSFLSYGQTPGFEWAVATDGPGRCEANAVTVDTAGNVYITGYFENTVDFDPGAGVFELTSNGHDDIFIQKLDADGNFIWAKQIGSNTFDEAHAIKTDVNNNVYVTGSFGYIADFDPGAGVFELTSNAYDDIFIQKLDADGNFIWAKQIAGTAREYAYAMDIDNNGDVLITGNIEGTTDFDPDPNNSEIIQAPGHFDTFVAKYNADGNYIWAKVFPNTNGNADATGYGITTDNNNNVLITGYFEQTVDFDGDTGQLLLTSLGGRDIFIEKLSSNGDLIWINQIGGTEHQEAYDIAVDSNNNIFLTGYFRGQTDFDPSATEFNITSGQDDEIFVEKFDENGNFVWAKAVADAGGTQRGYGIAVNTNDEIVFTGKRNGIYIEKSDNDGNEIWSLNLQGNGNNTLGYDICIDANDKIITTGVLNGNNSVDFDPSNNEFLLTPASGWGNAFVYKLNNTGVNIRNYDILNGVYVYPNPVVNELYIKLPENKTYEVLLIDMLGRKIKGEMINSASFHLSMNNLPAGIYLLSVFDHQSKQSKTLKIQKL